MQKPKNVIATFGIFFTFLLQTVFASNALAGYLSLGESGEIVPESTFQFGVAPQVLTNSKGGFNIAAFLDAAWTDSLSSRFMLGAGEIDFYISGSLKYIPFPDVARQPSIGVKLSLWYARDGAANINTVQVAPMISKKYQTASHGLFVPYAAYGISNYSVAGKNKTGDQFFIGTDWRNPDFDNVLLTGEIASSMKDSTSSVSVFVSVPFDDKKGFGSK